MSNVRTEIFKSLDKESPTTEEQLEKAYLDPWVWDISGEILSAQINKRPNLVAELDVYLAAAFALFAEERQIIKDSLGGS